MCPRPPGRGARTTTSTSSSWARRRAGCPPSVSSSGTWPPTSPSRCSSCSTCRRSGRACSPTSCGAAAPCPWPPPQTVRRSSAARCSSRPPDHHLVVEGTNVRLTRAAKVNGHRPAIDPLFESASRSIGPRVLGILLSGMLDGGVAGLGAIRAAGGVTAVPHPDEAACTGMPGAAIDAGVADEVLRIAALERLVAALERLVAEVAGSGPLRPVEVPAVVEEAQGLHPGGQGVLTSLTCPNCGGSIWHREVGGVDSFECGVEPRHRVAARAPATAHPPVPGGRRPGRGGARRRQPAGSRHRLPGAGVAAAHGGRRGRGGRHPADDAAGPVTPPG